MAQQGSRPSIKETLLVNGQYFNAMIQDINQAKKSIDLEVYIFANDELGEKVTNALVAAARRGVKVRVLVDGIGSSSWEWYHSAALDKAGVKARTYRPWPWLSRRWLYAQKQGSTLSKILYLLFRVNRRNHRKTCVIDSNIVYVGSANITINHVDKEHGGSGWRDTTIRLENIDTAHLQSAFEKVWHHFPVLERAKLTFKKIRKNPVFRLNYSRHQRRVLYKDLLKRMARSKRRIWITNSYFMPNAALLNTLSYAAKHGSDVKVLLPNKSDIFFYPWVTRLFYTELLNSGVSIYEYQLSMLHAKTIIIDDYFLVGSSNLNSRSLLHDLEVDVHVQDKEVMQQLAVQFKNDLENSEEIHSERIKKLSRVKKLFAWLVLYLRYWI